MRMMTRVDQAGAAQGALSVMAGMSHGGERLSRRMHSMRGGLRYPGMRRWMMMNVPNDGSRPQRQRDGGDERKACE